MFYILDFDAKAFAKAFANAEENRVATWFHDNRFPSEKNLTLLDTSLLLNWDSFLYHVEVVGWHLFCCQITDPLNQSALCAAVFAPVTWG